MTLSATPLVTPATKPTSERGQALRSFLLEQAGLVAAPLVVGDGRDRDRAQPLPLSSL